MSRRSACSRGKDPNSNITSKFANSPYLERVQPQKAKKYQDEVPVKQERPLIESMVEQPKQTTLRGARGGGRSRGSDSVSSYITKQSIKSSQTRQSSSLVSRARISHGQKIDMLLPSEVDKLLIAFSSKHTHDNNHLLAHNRPIVVQDDDSSTIATATSIDDNRIYKDKECREEVFSSDLFANIFLAQDLDSLTLEVEAVDGNISDLESVESETKRKLSRKKKRLYQPRRT